MTHAPGRGPDDDRARSRPDGGAESRVRDDGPEPVPAPEEPGPEAATTEEARADAEDELEDPRALRDQLLRLAAEFDNYRKREGRERADAWQRAKADLIEKLLEPIDDLTRVSHPEIEADTLPEAASALLTGVALVERKLLQALEREGLRRVEAEGAAFDPAVHEAVLTQPTQRPELDGRVAHVVLPGYRFGDRLLRAAQVVVWKLQG